MTPKVEQVYREGKNDKKFLDVMKDDDPTFKEPRFYSDEMAKCFFAAIYHGYKLGTQS